MKIVYIASPYTVGNKEYNVHRSLNTAEVLYQNGFLPFAPLLSHYWDLVYPHPYDYWMKMDLEWVRRCDMVLRLSGNSRGADTEVALANELGIPVYTSIGDLLFYEHGKDNYSYEQTNLGNPKN